METKNIEQELREDLSSAKKAIGTLKHYLIIFKKSIDLRKKYENEFSNYFSTCCAGCDSCDPNGNWVKKVDGKMVDMTEYEIKEKEIDLDLQLQNVIYLENRVKNIMQSLIEPIKKEGE